MRTTVLLHWCRHADEDDGRDFQCDCRKRVTKLQAQWLIRNGSFTVKKIRKSNGQLTSDTRQLVPCGDVPRLRIARMISEKDIERAYTSETGQFARLRIEIFGQTVGVADRIRQE